MQFFIVNDCDRPSPRHVTYADGDYLFYLHRSLENFGKMTKRHGSTPLEDFGIEAEEIEGGILFNKVRPSVATYPDGRPRDWQGAERFILPYPYEDEDEQSYAAADNETAGYV